MVANWYARVAAGISAFLLAVPFVQPATAQTLWTGADPEHPDSWFAPDNWSDGVPTSDTDAWIEQFETGPTVIDAPGAAARSAIVGMEGEGELQISAGGTLHSDDATIGMFFGSEGTATITGEGALWSNAGSLVIGEGENAGGTIRIEDGGRLETGSASIGQGEGSWALIEIAGEGSVFSVSGEIVVGDGGGSTIQLLDGGTLVAGEGAGTVQLATEDPDLPGLGVLLIGSFDADAPGHVAAAAVELLQPASRLIFQHNADDYVFDPAIRGVASSEVEIRSGYTEFTGDSSEYEGLTYVYNTGVLAVTGSLGGWIEVSMDAMLTGDGTTGELVIGYGGTLSPGMGIGTLHVDGDLSFNVDGTLLVEVDPQEGKADRIHVTGTATLDAGTVRHVGPDATFPLLSTHTILTAEGGVFGTFDGVTSDLVFLDPVLLYDPNNVYLQLKRNDIALADFARTPNQLAIAQALEAGGEPAGPYEAILALSDADEIASALGQLSGQSHAQAGRARAQRAMELNGIVSQRLRGGTDGLAAVGQDLVLPYLSTGRPVDEAGWTLWTAALASQGDYAADVAGEQLALLIGGEITLDTLWRVGAFAGFGGSQERLTGARHSSDDLHFGVYVGAEPDPLWWGAALVHSRHSVRGSRSVAFGDFDETLASSYRAGTTQLMAEAGINIPVGVDWRLTPYAGIAWLHQASDGFTETGGTAALTVGAAVNDTFRTKLAIDGEADFALGGMPATLHLGAGWQHDFGPAAEQLAVAFADGAPFDIVGSSASRDRAFVEAGIEARLGDNAMIAATYGGSLAGGHATHGLRIKLGIDLSGAR